MNKIQNPFSELKKHEWILWGISLVIAVISGLFAEHIDILHIIGTAIGVTALIFNAKGHAFGQILIIIFAILYAITSYQYKYYGEMITYLGMSAPMAAMAAIEWIKNPFEKGKNEVKIQFLSVKQKIIVIGLTIIVTFIFYFILKALKTPNLLLSTFSVTTSFLAASLVYYRNSYYAIAYSVNDIVLIALWVLASLSDKSYIPMVVCFIMFFVNDMYAFISWKMREKTQKLR